MTAEIAERAVGRHFDRERRNLGEAVVPLHGGGDVVLHLMRTLRIMNECRRAGKSPACRMMVGTLVLRLSSVRLDGLVFERRVHVGEEPIGIAERSQRFSGHDAHPHIVEQATSLKRPSASRRAIGSRHARVYTAHNG